MKRKLFLPVVLLPLVLGAFAVTDRITFSNDAWLQDYAQLKQELEQSYANLKWSRSAKKIDLVALNGRTERELRAARNTKQAREAITQFLRGFDDAHLHIESGPPKFVTAVMNLWPKARTTTIDFTMNAGDACDALGYKQNGSFKGRIVTTSKGKYGVIRIPLFNEYDYGAGCERAWQIFKPARSGVCDDKCQEDFGVIAKQEVSELLAAEARRLSHDAPDGVVIDLTGNGGGSEWAEYAAAAMSAKPLTPPRVAGIRGPHWKKELGDSADVKCALSRVWTDRSFEPSCWNVVVLPKDTSAGVYIRRPFSGKVFVLVDEKTASASEYFAAVLQDNRAATIIGTPTLGVGCGYTNGGVNINLANSGLTIRTPDCVRLRANGGNEYMGITPDGHEPELVKAIMTR